MKLKFQIHLRFLTFDIIFYLIIVQLGLNLKGQPYRKDLNGLGRSVTLNLVYPLLDHFQGK